MREEIVNNFEELHTVFAEPDFTKSIFRGVTDSEKHLLIPSIGRYESRTGASFASFEKRTFKIFKEGSIPFLDTIPRNDLEWLALAQHHGLPTRLLDWTYNPLVAAFFAVENHHDGNSAIYIYSGRATIASSSKIDPFDIDKVYKFRPPHISPRITAQRGVFTIHPDPHETFSPPDKLTKITIAKEGREKIKYQLYRYNISHASLFPGLDGLSKLIKWRHAKIY